MEELDYWRFCGALSVVRTALLVVGGDPSEHDFVEDSKEDFKPTGFTAVFEALKTDILEGRLKAKIKHEIHAVGLHGVAERYEDDEIQVRSVHPKLWYRIDENDPLYTDSGQGYAMKTEPDWKQTTIMVDDIKDWLINRGVTTGFFFPNETKSDIPGYLDPDNKYYAPKLAAAVNAWLTVTSDPKQHLKGKTPKQALTKWLNENAARYGLSDHDGTPKEKVIDKVSKISNWRPQGGVAKTPGS